MSDQFFKMQLEDYSIPEFLPCPKTYYGTLEQIEAVINQLAADPATATKYASTIQAFADFKNGNAESVHTIMGQTMRLLTPVTCIHETVILEQDVQWYFSNGVYSHRVHADFVDLHQALLVDGDLFIRVVKPCYEGIRYEDPYEGWISMPACHYGFPGIYTTAPGWHYMRLYVTEQIAMSVEPCLIRMNDAYHVSHYEACNDLFGGRVSKED